MHGRGADALDDLVAPPNGLACMNIHRHEFLCIPCWMSTGCWGGYFLGERLGGSAQRVAERRAESGERRAESGERRAESGERRRVSISLPGWSKRLRLRDSPVPETHSRPVYPPLS